MKGVVTRVSESHHSRNHLNVEVAHGKRKPKQKPKKGESAGMIGGDYDDRPTSTLLVHKKDAAKYPIGQSLNVMGQPVDDGNDVEGDEDLDDMQKRLSKAQRR